MSHTYVYEIPVVVRLTVRADDMGRAEAVAERSQAALVHSQLNYEINVDRVQFTFAASEDEAARPVLVEHDGEPAR